MACVFSRYNARSDWLILSYHSVFSRTVHGPITGLQNKVEGN